MKLDMQVIIEANVFVCGKSEQRPPRLCLEYRKARILFKRRIFSGSRKKNILAKTGFERSVDMAFYVVSHGWINLSC